MGKRSELSIPQRRDVVLMLLRREDPAAKLARRFGVSEQTLYRWRDEFLAGGKGGVDPHDREIRELKKKVEGRDQRAPTRSVGRGELTIANRILKKTADGSY